jgi:hypothetical protein
LQYHVVEQDASILDRDKLEKRERLAHSCMPASAKSSLIGAAGAPRLGQRMSPGQVACAQISGCCRPRRRREAEQVQEQGPGGEIAGDVNERIPWRL